MAPADQTQSDLIPADLTQSDLTPTGLTPLTRHPSRSVRVGPPHLVKGLVPDGGLEAGDVQRLTAHPQLLLPLPEHLERTGGHSSTTHIQSSPPPAPGTPGEDGRTFLNNTHSVLPTSRSLNTWRGREDIPQQHTLSPPLIPLPEHLERTGRHSSTTHIQSSPPPAPGTPGEDGRSFLNNTHSVLPSSPPGTPGEDGRSFLNNTHSVLPSSRSRNTWRGREDIPQQHTLSPPLLPLPEHLERTGGHSSTTHTQSSPPPAPGTPGEDGRTFLNNTHSVFPSSRSQNTWRGREDIPQQHTLSPPLLPLPEHLERTGGHSSLTREDTPQQHTLSPPLLPLPEHLERTGGHSSTTHTQSSPPPAPGTPGEDGRTFLNNTHSVLPSYRSRNTWRGREDIPQQHALSPPLLPLPEHLERTGGHSSTTHTQSSPPPAPGTPGEDGRTFLNNTHSVLPSSRSRNTWK